MFIYITMMDLIDKIQSVTSVNLQLFKERSELQLTPFIINLLLIELN